MFKQFIVRLIVVTFFFTSVGPLPNVSAQNLIDLPAPGMMVNRSSYFEPLQLKGILVNVKNPLRFDFLVDRGDSSLYGQPLKDNITRLAKYFLTCLTVPENDLWVNLSPYEKDRIVPGNFGITLMGKDLLEQDYLLKQMMASLSYPENDLGKRFWQRVYRRSYELYGTTEIPINTFNKVWIIPRSAQVYAQGNSAFVVNSQLDVMLEADYRSYVHHLNNKDLAMNSQGSSQNAGAYSQVFRDVILPELRQEVNEGKNFAVVRQVYNAMILATWYKRHLKDSLLGRMYVGRNEVSGVDIADKNAKEKIFQQYLKAYKKCVYNYIKEDFDPMTQQTVPHKYASGGMYFAGFGGPDSVYKERPNPKGMNLGTDLAMATVDLSATNSHGAVIRFPYWKAEVTNTHPFHQIPMEVYGRSFDRARFDQAVLVPAFFRRLILPLVLAAGGMMMTPAMASAAAPVSSKVIQITVNMNTQEAVQILDHQIIDSKKKIHAQDSLLNILGTLGDPNVSGSVLHGLQLEESYAQALLAAGHTTIDQPEFNSLEITNLTGQIEILDQLIKERQQAIDDGKAQFKKRDRSHDMHAAEVSMRQGRISYDEGVLKDLIAKKGVLNKERILIQEQTKNPPPAVITPAPIVKQVADRVVPDALGSGLPVNNILPLPAPAASPAISTALPAAPSVSASNTPSISGIFNLTTPFTNNVPAVSQMPQLILPLNPAFGSTVNGPPGKIDVSTDIRTSTVNPNVTAGSPPPPDDTYSEFFDMMNSTWALYGGMAILGVGLGVGGIIALKKRKLKTLNNPSSDQLTKPARNLSAGNVHSGNWGFNVVTNETTPAPNAAELAWMQQQQQTIPSLDLDQPIVSPVAQKPSTSGLRMMDVLGLIMTTGLAAIYSAGDLRTMLIASLSSLCVTRLFYAGYIFLHENSHNGIAILQSPRNYKKIRTWSNFFINYNFANWLRLGLVFGKPTHRPGVDLPLEGSSRRFNQVVVFGITTAVVGLAFWAAVKTGLWLPLFGSLSAASLFVVFNSFISDIWNPSSQGRIECGDSGVIWLPKKNRSMVNGVVNGRSHLDDFFPEFVQDGLVNMRQISGLRGDQGKGLATWGETRDGDVIPLADKRLKDKRGKPVAEVAQEGFKAEIQDAMKQGIRPLDEVREVMTHDRFLTQGTPSLKGLHPHLGVTEKRSLCFYENGKYQKRERTVVSIVIENGDNNYHKKHGRIMPTRDIRQFYPVKFHMKKDVFIEPNAKFPKGYYDYLPSGDAPPLALQEQWYDNQGDWWAASRFVADEIFYKNDKEAMEYNLSEDEVNAMGDFFMRVYENGHEQILIRPKLEKKNKTLADSWVTQEMVQQDPRFSFQYNALENFRAELKSRLLTEAQKARSDDNISAVGNILDRLQQLHPEDNFEQKIDRFVDLTVKRFFTADILEAAKEIDALEVEGAYGVRILSSKYPGRGVFWTKGQSIALGVNKEAGYMAYNSEHTALMSNFGNTSPVKEILFLNSEGAGQLTETSYNEETQDLDIRAWSPEKGRFLNEDDLKEWRMELNKDNKYWTPLVKRDPKTVTDQDITDISKVTKEVNDRWEDPDSFVSQSAEEFVKKLVSRYVETYIKTNSRFYKVLQGNLLFYIDQEIQKLQGNGYSSQGTHKRTAVLLRKVQNDPRILSYLKSRLDQEVAYEADILSQQIMKGEKTEDDLFPQLKIMDQQLSELMTREVRILTDNLISNNTRFLKDFDAEQSKVTLGQKELEQLWNSDNNEGAGVLKPGLEGKGLPSKESVGSGEAVIYATGLEDSLWLGSENLKNMLLAFFPSMMIETDSSNKTLDLRPGDRHKVGRRTLALVVSKSGATSPTKNVVGPLKQITTPDDIFAMTGRVDTLLGLSLGQKFYTGAPFGAHIFPLGNSYPTEINSVSEVELLVNQIDMVLYIVKYMKKIFPNQRPWGMNVSEENIKKLEKWRDNMVNKARHLTGVDEEGNPGSYQEHEKIVQNGKIFGKMLAETPLSNLGVRAYVFSIIYLGVPVGALAAFIEKKTGLSVYSSGWGHLAWAFLDTVLACSMPWWITTGFYRSLSGRVQRWARLGPPKVVIGDVPVLNQVIEISASKRASLAIGSMDPDIHGANAQDHFGARFLHRVRRGTVEIFGLPEDPHALAHVLLTDSQSNVRTDMSIGRKIWDLIGKRFNAGPEIFTIGPGDVDPNLSQHHMSTGPLETVIINSDGERKLRGDVTDTMAKFHSRSFEIFDRLIAYNVFFNEGFHWATNWGPWQVWRQGESYSRTGVFSTPSPRNGPKSKLPPFQDSDKPYSAGNAAGDDKALMITDTSQQTASRDGGINMNSRLMHLNITGEAQNRIGDDDTAMSGDIIKDVVPKVSQIVTVTPDMLKAMLGQAYLN